MIIFQLSLIFLLLPNVGSHFTDGKAWLTNAKKSPGLHNVPAKTQDQCLPQPNQEHIKPYTLRFFRKQLENICDGVDDALLLCYESMLDANKSHIGLINSIPFRIKRNLSNNATRLCEQKRMASGHKDNRGIPWNGILVRNVVEADGKQLLVVELSLEKQSLIFEDLRQLDIVLMTDRQSYSSIIPASDWKKHRPIERPGEDKLRKQYMKNVHRGIRMHKHEGLWMLGLDMLPHFDIEHQLRLFIYRACSCSMEAFLMSPTDAHEPLLDQIPLSIGQKGCDQNIDQAFSMDGQHNAIAIRGFTAVNEIVSVNITLLGGDEEFHVTIEEKSVTMRGGREKLLTFGDKTKLGQGELFQLEMHIHVYELHFRLKVQYKNALVELKLTPVEWWKGGLEKKIKKMELQGNFLLLRPPRFFNLNKSQEESTGYYVYTPYVEKLEGMMAGSRFGIKGKINENAQFMQIALLHNAPERNEYSKIVEKIFIGFLVGATPMEFYFDFTLNILYISTFMKNEQLNVDGIHSLESPLKKGDAFDIEVQVSNENFVIFINAGEPIKYKRHMKYWIINWLRINGDVILFGKPVVKISKKKENGTKFFVGLPTLLRGGDTIEFSGTLLPKAKLFEIYLMHGAVWFDKKDPIGDVVMRLQFEFGQEKNLVWANYYDDHKWNDEVEKMNKNLLPETSSFVFTIYINQTDFNINSTNKERRSLSKEMLSFPQHLPAWTVDHIWITGEVEMEKPNIVIAAHDNRIKQLEGHTLGIGDLIKLNGSVNVTKGFSVSLFHEALTYNEKFGETVLEIHMFPNGTQFSFRSFYDGTNHPDQPIMMPINFSAPMMPTNLSTPMMPTNLSTPMMPELKLAFQIQVLAESYNITIEGDDLNIQQQYNHILPVWAVQYVVVEGGFKVEGQIEVVKF